MNWQQFWQMRVPCGGARDAGAGAGTADWRMGMCINAGNAGKRGAAEVAAAGANNCADWLWVRSI